MPDDGTHEQTVNVALGEELAKLREGWSVLADRTGRVLTGGGRPDVLVLEPAGWPVAIEAKHSPNRRGAEQSAINRLGSKPVRDKHTIETAIALVYPSEFADLDGAPLRRAIRETTGLEYALYTHITDHEHERERLPVSGWLHGGLKDLAMLVRRATIPARRVDELADALAEGVEDAAKLFEFPLGSERGVALANVLGQSDDKHGQTRRMAMTVIVNALVFHESLAEAEFRVPASMGERAVRSVEAFWEGPTFLRAALVEEWETILKRNYWPIFASAKQMLAPTIMPSETAARVSYRLWQTAERLVQGGVTRSHDLTGAVFQRLIADRKFLATYYTRPEAAALLAGLALPIDRPPGGAEWRDAETLAATQIGDFACGTGTLLSAAYQRLSLLHELHGGDPKALHGPMMKNGLVGLDVLNIAVHLTAAMLASSHPDTPFDGECLLTMPYGEQEDGSVAIGSLDLLATEVQAALIGQAAATTAGGRKPEDVADLVNRVGHAKFDLVIMNPPYKRPTGNEGETEGTGNAAFAAFQTSRDTQERMQDRLNAVRGSTALGSGNAGLGSDFTDLALRKQHRGGRLALVLPLSAVSGVEWEGVRRRLYERGADITVVTIADAGSAKRSFSEDTGMAECLVSCDSNDMSESRKEPRGYFVVLDKQPSSSMIADLIASKIRELIGRGAVRTLEGGFLGGTSINIGDDHCGTILDCPISNEGSWPLVGISDIELSQVSYRLVRGQFTHLGEPGEQSLIPMATIGTISNRGRYHADIYWDNADGSPRGPFQLIKPAVNTVPTYPMLWAHATKKERQLVVSLDSEGQIKSVDARFDQESVNEKAGAIWATATRAHYNRDLQFNSQSLIVAMTERKCIGGRAWPSVIFEKPEHEYAFALWCNSTLGLLLHWWTANKTQSGRGTTTVTAIPRIPTLDVRALTAEQHARAHQAFEQLRDERFLPFDQIDEDEARAKLDRALLVDVLGLPESLCAPDGPMDLLRRKLAAEPQIHGGKRSRVIFTETGERRGSRRHR